jgi:hypothetical protein
LRDDLDGTEVMHPLAYSAGFAGWKWEDLRAFYEKRPGLMPIGSSDYHWGTHMGLCRTYVFVNEPVTEDAVLEALRARRTVVVDREGRYYGPPPLVDAVANEPIPARAIDYRYAGEGLGDRILRAIGFFGLVGLVLMGARTRRTSDIAA